MASEQELKKLESLAKGIAKIMGFDSSDLAVEKDKTDTVKYMAIRLYYPWETRQNILNYLKETILEKTIKKHNTQFSSTLKTTIVIGKNYELQLKEKLTHELGHARFLNDHPFIHLILQFLSLPYDFLFDKTNGKTETDKYYIAKAIPLILSQYGTVSLIANHINEYIAGYEGRKRGLKAHTYA